MSDQTINQDLVDVLTQRLEMGLVTFFYKKTDGSIRKAYGTRKQELIPRVSNVEYDKHMGGLTAIYDSLRDAVGVDEIDVTMLGEAMGKFVAFMAPKAKGNYTTSPDTSWVNYWDFEANAWRKFNVESVTNVLP